MSDIQNYILSAYGLNASVTNFGASLQDLRLADDDIPLVLGFENPSDYATNTSHLGASAGSYANRIANGRYQLNDKTYQLDQNENNQHMLHGGHQGTGVQLWDCIEACDDAVLFQLHQPSGHMGFEGDLELICRYEMVAPQILSITYEAVCDRPRFINIAHHSYFKLDDSPTIDNHELEIYADEYLPVDDNNIPTGELCPVAHTDFDFRKKRPIGNKAYDHNYCLAPSDSIRPVARLRSARSGLCLTLHSDQIGLQFYSSDHLDEQAPNHHGRPYQPRDGICLEPQFWPNSPNMPHFPSAYVPAHTRYKQTLWLEITRDEGASS